MQLKLFLAGMAFILPIQVTAQYYAIPTSLLQAKASQVHSDINAYYDSLTAAPAYSSAVSVLRTATVNPKTINMAASPTNWYTALPTEVQPYFSSVQAAVYGIVNRDLGGVTSVPSVSSVANAVPAGPGVKYSAAMAAAAMAAFSLL